MLPTRRPHPDLPLLQCPVCGACSIHPAGGRPGGLFFFFFFPTKKGGEPVRGSAAARAPTPPTLHPSCLPRPSPRPTCSGDRVWSARPRSNSLPGTRPGRLWGLGSRAGGSRGGGAELGRRRLAGAGGCALFTLGAVSRLACGARGCDVQPPLPAPGAPLRAFLPKPAPLAVAALQTHVSEAVPVLDLAAVLRDGRQPLLVLHEIAGGLALLEPFGVAFGQGGRGEEQQRQHQPPAARGAHRGPGPTWGGGGVLTSAVF